MGYLPETHNVSVYRQKATGSKSDYDTVATYTGVDCAILPAGTDILALYPGESVMQLYEVIIQEAGYTIRNGDKLVDSSGNSWIIRGVPQVFNLPHLYYQRCVGEKVI
jgi:hypothetical protein